LFLAAIYKAYPSFTLIFYKKLKIVVVQFVLPLFPLRRNISFDNFMHVFKRAYILVIKCCFFPAAFLSMALCQAKGGSGFVTKYCFKVHNIPY